MRGQISVVYEKNPQIKFTYEKGICLKKVSEDFQKFYQSPVVAAKVNHIVKDLQSCLDEDVILDFVELNSEWGIKIYQRSISFLLIAAVKECMPSAEVTVEHSLGNGLFCELHLGRPICQADVDQLESHMRQIIAQDRPILKQALLKEEAILLFEKSGQKEKAQLIRNLEREKVSIYYCGDVYDYLYGPMIFSTGQLQLFALTLYKSGLIVRVPQKGRVDIVPSFVEQEKLANIFAEAEQWAGILHCNYVEHLNGYTRRKDISDIIRVSEALHEKKFAQIADFISKHIDQVRLISIAGPSSSGKTTFAQRLRIQLRVNGIVPETISLDDYFMDRIYTPRDEKGNYDFEALEALDIELFNEHLVLLLRGEEVEIPYYNFITGTREWRGNVIQLKRNQPIIIEGIHGLNERLTQKVPRENKFKIYISALTQLAIDGHNRIPTTDTRLIRRIVRDYHFRGSNALKSLRQWPAVRHGEEKNIFPYQEEADVMFNSALIYELGVLKKYAEPLLQKVEPKEAEYAEAVRLLDFLAYFEAIEDEREIPVNSILREFIGKSCFAN